MQEPTMAPEAEIDNSTDGTIEKPINREPPVEELVSQWITEEDNYDRNHGPIQHKLSAEHTVLVDGLVTKTLKLSIEDLKNRFQQQRITCALLCAGNRRHTMRTRIKEVQGIDWFDGAIMNCTWEGPRLSDILREAGVDNAKTQRKMHVQFASHGTKTQEDDWYGGSIPFQRAMDPDMDVIIAIEMNGKPLPQRHGFPVRAIVPGVVGARSVKWLDQITISDQESPNHYQRRDYKILPPDAVDADTADKYWDRVPALMEMPVNACVAVPTFGSTVSLPPDGFVEVKGYAVPQGPDGPVRRVQVSSDEGKSWTDAVLDYGPKDLASKWSWVLWTAKVKMDKGTDKKIFAKATDAKGNTQDTERSPWNLRGVAYNGYEAVFDITVI